MEEESQKIRIVLNSERKSPIKRILKKLSIPIVVAIMLAYFIFSQYPKNEENFDSSFIPIIKSQEKPIKVPHNIEEEIKIKNLDIEVYDNITDIEKRDYGQVTTFNGENTGKSNEFLETAKEIKEQMRQEKSGNYGENFIQVVEPYEQLGQNLKNKNLAENIKMGKDLKPSIKAQLSASGSKENSEKYWEILKKDYPELLKGKTHFIEMADLGDKGMLYRLQVGFFEDMEQAKAFCKEFILVTKRNKADCIIIKNR